MPELVQPSSDFQDSYIEALKEGYNPNTTEPPLSDKTIQKISDDFDGYLLSKIRPLQKTFLAPDGQIRDRVPQTTLWLVDDENCFIGNVNIRHYLNDFLIKYGGHIGYAIRPSKQFCGYGTLILRLALAELKTLSPQTKQALITTSEHNKASQTVIERNCGILENIAEYDWLDYKEMRYWVDL